MLNYNMSYIMFCSHRSSVKNTGPEKLWLSASNLVPPNAQKIQKDLSATLGPHRCGQPRSTPHGVARPDPDP